MRFSRRVSRKVWRFIKAELKSWVTLEGNRCNALSREGKQCIKQGEHLLWHEDAWKVWWW
jgi:hypothetical protein